MAFIYFILVLPPLFRIDFILLFEELVDRFGPPPPEMIAYLTLQRVVIMSKTLGLHELLIDSGRLIITFHPETRTPQRVIKAVLKLPESPFIALGSDQVCCPLSDEQKRMPERSAVESLLYFHDLLPQATVL